MRPPGVGPALLLSAAVPLVLGGLLELPAGQFDRVPWAGCWVFPVGDSLELGGPGPGGEAPYVATRNVSRGRGVRVHDGADLSNRTGGGLVRAAAHGLVLFAGPGRAGNGFGWHVVLAHRELDGEPTYSVYAHLASGSTTVEPGRIVLLGTPLGRVGRTGRATANHLHFEVRRPGRLDDRWEKATVTDPLAWIAARRPVAREDSSWALPALAWAEGLGGLTAETPGDELLTRAHWWRMLAAVRPGPLSPSEAPARMRRSLEEQGVIPPGGSHRGGEPPSVEELDRDLERLAVLGALAPVPPIDEAALRAALPARMPWRRREPPATGRERPVLKPAPLTVADAALLLLAAALDHQSAAGPAPPLGEAVADSIAAR